MTYLRSLVVPQARLLLNNFSISKMPSIDRSMITRPLKSVVSASWLYPFKGIYFFATNPAWWPLMGRRIIPLVLVSIVVFGLLFTFAYLPQVAFLALFGHGPGAWLNALFLVLGEGAVVIALLFEALLVDETLVDVFDAVIPALSPFRRRNVLTRFRSLSSKAWKTLCHQPVPSIKMPRTRSKCWAGQLPLSCIRHSRSDKSLNSFSSYLLTSFHMLAYRLSCC